MADVEIKRKVRLTREQAGERLMELGKALVAAPESELNLDGDSIRFTVGDRVQWEFELEVDGDEIELEIELKWSTAKPAAPAPAKPAAAKPATAKPAAAPKRSRTARAGRADS
jgi:amphi-Trp domain-containing protein